MSFCLRRADPADVDALATVHVQAWREAYAGLIPADVLDRLDPSECAVMWRHVLASGSNVWLAEQDGAILGFGSCGPQRDPTLPYAGEIGAIYVLRRGQRRGIGRALMTAMASDLLAQGHVSASLWVLQGNHPARQFYAALGGREVTRQDQQRGGFQAVGIAYGWDDVRALLR